MMSREPRSCYKCRSYLDQQDWSGSDIFDNKRDTVPPAAIKSLTREILVKIRIHNDPQHPAASLRSQITFSPYNPHSKNKSEKERKALRWTARCNRVCSSLKKQGLREDMWLVMVGRRVTYLMEYEHQMEFLLLMLNQSSKDQAHKPKDGLLITFSESSPFHHWIEGIPHCVGTRCEILSITNINTVKQTFDCRLSLHFVWQPSKLQMECKDKRWRDSYWYPTFKFPNITKYETREYRVNKRDWAWRKGGPFIMLRQGDRNEKGFKDQLTVGAVNKGVIEIIATFAEQFELQQFPFDVQDLTLVIWSLTTAEICQFVPISLFYTNRDFSGRRFKDCPDLYCPAPGFGLVSLSTRFSTIGSEWIVEDPIVDVQTKTFSNIWIRNKVKRKPEVYVVRMVLPMALVTLGSCAAFFISLDQEGERLNYGFSTVLTAVVYQLVIYNELPHIPYMTLLDKYILACFIYMFCIVIETGVMKEIHEVSSDKEKVEEIDGLIAWGFLSAYVFLNAWFAWKSTCERSLESRKTNMNGIQLERYFDIEGEDWKEVNCKYHFQCNMNEWNNSYATYKSYGKLKDFTQLHQCGAFDGAQEKYLLRRVTGIRMVDIDPSSGKRSCCSRLTRRYNADSSELRHLTPKSSQ